jgi:Dolichyl-phosphate-mannose-protein mannosyltransferase
MNHAEADARSGEPRCTADLAVRPVWMLLAALAVRLPFVWIAPNNGADAAARLQGALDWLQDPMRLPGGTAQYAWLPLHYWLLGAVLWLWRSPLSARLFTALLGALTILPYWGILRRAFDARVAVASALAFACFGFHVAYSVTTSSEVPTLFFLIGGVYFWLSFLIDSDWKWCWVAALSLSAASLIRFEAWIFIPVLSALLLDFSRGWVSLWSNRAAWRRAIVFGLAASAGAIGWMIYSDLKWGDPMELPHRTIRWNLSVLPVLRHSLLFRLAVVPVSLVVAMSPVIVLLAAVGIVWVLARGSRISKSLAVLSLGLFAWNYLSAVRYELTRARYTLIYAWLLLPFAFEALRRLTSRWTAWSEQRLYAAAFALLLLWNVAIVAGAQYAPVVVADRLAVMSPTLDPPVEVRGLLRWLRHNVPSTNPMVVDLLELPSGAIVDYQLIYDWPAFQIAATVPSNSAPLKEQVRAFIRSHHPRFAVCSPYGPLGRLWFVDDREQVDLPAFDISLHLEWHDAHWSVYRIDHLPAAPEGP